MTLKEKISKDYIDAFKAKNAISKSLLSTVKGEITTQEKNLMVPNLSDEESIKILNKFAKNLKENVRILSSTSNIDALNSTKSELIIIESYLPKEMTKEEIQVKVKELINSGATNIGAIMKGFQGLPADRKLVSEISKDLFTLLSL